MTLFIRTVSGVDLLEKDLKNSKPGYAEYIASTPPFLPKMSFWIGLVFFCAALLWGKGLFANSIAPEQELPFRTIFFQVKDPKDGKLLSNGTEKIVVEKGLISKETLYYLGEDKTKVIQSETCTFDLATLRPVTYSFLNSITGEKVSINLPPPPALDGQVEYQASTTKPASPFKIKWNESMAIGKTLHHIIVRAWNDLLQGKSRAFQLYVPIKQDQYSFRVIKADKDKKYSAEDTVLISLELDNWALRQLAPSMNFYYSSKSKVPQLVRYEGPTTVVLDDDTDKKVTIDFQYEI
jgi:hypothetical protein